MEAARVDKELAKLNALCGLSPRDPDAALIAKIIHIFDASVE